ncbi:DUF4383 domain-containing protein [Umezawaea endophytica]|uniref:DUF4383 domain-containing protein n=1 Tax=Umezawaea endophytica TaxID=1654476 RepID=A0A9X2VT21_9PSEU|nr:DUF4383 domain-containing protein [Umezawaea endophytica]MCS7481827.1 DUF4383 domain-containing protein [Umezawaea endophytica]
MRNSTAGRVKVKVAGLQPAQVLVALVSLLFIAAGVVGFLRTGFGDFAGDEHAMVLGFAVNPLHNVIHLAFGVLGLLLAGSSALARTYGWVLFIAYGAVFIWGLMLAGVISSNPVSGMGNPLALNSNDNWLHLGFAAVGLLIAVLPARRKIIVDEPELVEQPVVEPAHETDHRIVPERTSDVNEPTTRDRDVVEPHTTTPLPAQHTPEPRTGDVPAQAQEDVKRHRVGH